MRWTYEHDIYLGREILLIKPHQDKPGSKESGNAWGSIAEDLNKISEVHFDVNQKDVRDWCRNLLEKHKKKKERKENLAPMRKTLNLMIYCKNIAEEWDEASASHNDQSKQKLKKIESEKSNAEDVRQQAMETFAETRKRKHKDDNSGSK